MLHNKKVKYYLLSGLASLALIPPCINAADSSSTTAKVDASFPVDHEYTFGEVVKQSMFGDVYSHPENWQELSISNFFSKGWDKPWVSPPTGGGGAPRQGWLNAYEAVFYRLSLGIFGWKHHTNNTDSYTGNLVTFTPINSRFEVETQVPASSNGEATNFGDFRIQARFLLSVNQRAKLTRVLGKTALKSFHPRLCKIRYFVGEPWSVNHGYNCRSQKTTSCQWREY